MPIKKNFSKLRHLEKRTATIRFFFNGLPCTITRLPEQENICNKHHNSTFTAINKAHTSCHVSCSVIACVTQANAPLGKEQSAREISNKAMTAERHF